MSLPEGVSVVALGNDRYEVTDKFGTAIVELDTDADEEHCVTCDADQCDHVLAVLEFLVPSEDVWELVEPGEDTDYDDFLWRNDQ